MRALLSPLRRWRWLVAAIGVLVAADAVAREPSAVVATCWQRLTTVAPANEGAREADDEAVRRLLVTPSGAALLAELCALFPGDGGPATTLSVHFVDHLRDSPDAVDGSFNPVERGAAAYELVVEHKRHRPAEEPTVFLFGEYPANSACAYVFFFEEAASEMAHTLFHELLHVWFLNAAHEAKPRYPTGHGAVTRCEFEEPFLAALRANAVELAALEGRSPLPPEPAR